jgi:RNA polymerase sigma factor (sigma-70 family)
MAARGSTVFIVEDEQPVRDALILLLGLRGFAVTVFADAESFLKAYQSDWSGCVLLDIRMPGIDGLSLQKRLTEIGCRMPVIIMTGHGDVDSAREAFRAQAVDFLEKPLDQGRLMSAILEAFQRQSTQAGAQESVDEIRQQLEKLTPRELEVMNHVVIGRHNRDIALELGISVRTVEVHKARMMTKLKAESVADLVRLSLGIISKK